MTKDPFFHPFFMTHGLGGSEPIKEAISKIIVKINKLEANLTLVMEGMDIVELRRFEEITPQFIYTATGCSIYWPDSITPTDDMVKEAFGYVTDMVMLWERKGIIGSKGNKSKGPSYTQWQEQKWREIRVEKWHPTTERTSGDK